MSCVSYEEVSLNFIWKERLKIQYEYIYIKCNF